MQVIVPGRAAAPALPIEAALEQAAAQTASGQRIAAPPVAPVDLAVVPEPAAARFQGLVPVAAQRVTLVNAAVSAAAVEVAAEDREVEVEVVEVEAAVAVAVVVVGDGGKGPASRRLGLRTADQMS